MSCLAIQILNSLLANLSGGQLVYDLVQDSVEVVHYVRSAVLAATFVSTLLKSSRKRLRLLSVSMEQRHHNSRLIHRPFVNLEIFLLPDAHMPRDRPVPFAVAAAGVLPVRVRVPARRALERALHRLLAAARTALHRPLQIQHHALVGQQ